MRGLSFFRSISKEKIMALLKEEKNQIVKEFQNSPADTGSPEVQIALLTENINKPVSYTHLTLPTICSV